MQIKEKISRVEINGKRWYQIEDDSGIVGVFPSVTTILSETSDKNFLKSWVEKVGHKEAEKISKDSTNRGTVMHRLCELYLNLPHDLNKKERLNKTLELAKTDNEILKFDTKAIIIGGNLFYNFYLAGCFDRIEKVFFQEQFLWSKISGGYAGTVDNFSQMDDGSFKIIDFKTSNKNKNEAWIENYKLQVSAYSIAIWERTGIKPHGAEIWISNENDRYPQLFVLDQSDIVTYFKEFIERLKRFYEINSSNIYT